MPGLTVTEKEHWKQRIARRIEKKIETLKAAEPNLMDRVEREARQQALASLGLAEMQTELDRIAHEREMLQKLEHRVEREMVAKVRGVPIEQIEIYYGRSAMQEVSNAVQSRQGVHQDELLAQSDVGHRILQLRAEKEELLDSTWLAVSPKQIKELWSKVAALLGDPQTQLQRDALAIEPIAE